MNINDFELNNNNIFPFNSDKLKSHIGASSQADYLLRYLKDLKTKTCVIEDKYIDKDYMIDYQKFYSRSFEEISKYTKRIHFFEKSFSAVEFKKILNGKEAKGLCRSYLGFTVIKKIPYYDNSLVGRTLLKTYPPRVNNGKRYFVSTSENISLFGIPLSLKSLPFQVQDRGVSACATIALWSALNPLTDTFGIVSRSPAEITEVATSYPTVFRNFPSSGLTEIQMMNYIKSTGLDVETIGIKKNLSVINEDIKRLIEEEKQRLKSIAMKKTKHGIINGVKIDNIKIDDVIDIRKEIISAPVKAYTNAKLPIIASIMLKSGYLFSFSDIAKEKEVQELLNRLRALGHSDLAEIIDGAKYSKKGRKIRITKNNERIATLKIEEDLCYLEWDNHELEIGVVKKEDDKLNIYKRSSHEEGHAVVISGYRCDNDRNLNELYVHDDQIGPFSRVKFDTNFNWINDWVTEHHYDKVELINLFIPVYHKLRLCFSSIFLVYLKKRIRCNLFTLLHSPSKFDVEIFLTQIQDYKRSLFEGKIDGFDVSVKDKEKILTAFLPRFLWVVRTYIDNEPYMDELYDGVSIKTRKLKDVRYLEK